MQASRKVGKESELDSIAPKSVLKYLSCVEKKKHLYTGQGPIDRPCLLIYILLYTYLAQLQINQAKNKSCTFPF